MPHKVRTEVANVTLPGVGRIDAANTTVTLTDADFAMIPASAFPSKVTDQGWVGQGGDSVGTQAAYVAPMGALTATTVATANATDLATAQALANSLKTTVNALIVDLTAARTTLNAELAALQGVGKPQAAS